MARNIAIGGASGLVGSRLTAALEQRGGMVHRLVRRQPTAGRFDVYWNHATREIDARATDPCSCGFQASC